MIIVFPILMIGQVIGQEQHELLGLFMILLFTLHDLFNWKWYKTMLKGKYTKMRTINLVINLFLLMSIVLLMLSGISMSQLFSVHVGLDISVARLIHLSISHWGFLIVSIHIGLHFNILKANVYKWKIIKYSQQWNLLFKTIVLCISFYGMYCFIAMKIINYLFLKSQFVFYDVSQPIPFTIMKYVCIMIAFLSITVVLQNAINYKKI